MIKDVKTSNKYCFMKIIKAIHLFRNILLLILLISSCKKEDFAWDLKKLPEIEKIELIENNSNSFSLSTLLKNNGNDKDCKVGYCISTDESFSSEECLTEYVPPSDLNFKFNKNWDGNYKYYVKAYAKNSIGKVFSEVIEVTFPTSNSTIPILTMEGIDSVSFNFADVSAKLITNGGLNITMKGFCISSNINPTLSNSTVIISNDPLPDFSEKIVNLTDYSTYYIRAFAQNGYSVGYSNVEIISTPKIYEIGEDGPGGGIVFYQNLSGSTNWHFLEAAPSDYPLDVTWSNTVQNCNVNATSIGSGEGNTSAIIDFYGTSSGSYAAKEAFNFTVNGFSDWFLPSLYELKEIHYTLFLNNLGSLSENSHYWTSSQDANFTENAWVLKMQSGSPQIYTQIKSQVNKIRPIRKF